MATSLQTRVIGGAITFGFVLTIFTAIVSIIHIVSTSAPDFLQYYEPQSNLLPPISKIAYFPLRLFPYIYVQAVWIIVSFICLLWVVWKLGRFFQMTDRQIMVVSMLAYFAFPTRFTLGMGQVNSIVLACLVLAVSHTSGFWYALSVLLKPEFVFLLIPLGIQTKWRIFALLIVIALLMLMGWGYAPPAFHWAGAGIYYNQGLSGFVSRAGGSYWMYGILAMFILSIWVYKVAKRNIRSSEIVWLFMPTFILIEPIAWQHHFVYLIPTFIFLWKNHQKFWTRWLLVVSYVLVSWNFSSPGFLATMPLGWFVISHATVGVFILWALTLL